MEQGRRRAAWPILALLAVALLLWFLQQDDGPRPDQELTGRDPAQPTPDALTAQAPEPQPAPQPSVEQPAPVEPPAPVPALPERFGDAKHLCDLVRAARLYFDLEEEQWKGRRKLLAELAAHAAEDRWFLKSPRALRWLVYQGRSFEPPWHDSRWRRSKGLQGTSLGGTLHHVASSDLRATYSIPRSHARPKDLGSDCPRQPPFPLLLSLHDAGDAAGGARHPGAGALARRYPPQHWDALYAQWLVLAPESATGRFVTARGMVRDATLKNPLADFWRRYHVDFDRIVLDGSEDAFTVATSMPVFFAGAVFRGGWTLETKDQRTLIRNLAPLPVYVVDNPALAQQLEDGGHSAVTSGAGDGALRRWMNQRKRRPPKSFSWTVLAKRYDQVLPYWINLDSPNWKAPSRGLHVEVIDTEEAPNTIRITAEGIDTLSLFLGDDIVDLDRNVRVVVNDHVEYDDSVPVPQPMRAVGRDLDSLFNRDPVRIRTSMFFGWLYPARIVNIKVRRPIKR